MALRGILRMLAGVTGLLLVYGFVYAMEGMTTRIPTSPIRELLMSTLWMLPWALLFCSGFHDLSIAAKRAWLFWGGSVLLILLVYYYERNTSSHELTKSLMPLLISIGGILPHVFRRLSVLYAICSVCAGLVGILVLYNALQTFLSAGSHFNTRTIAALMVTFALTSVGAGALSVMRL
jgi:hypothetical protein